MSAAVPVELSFGEQEARLLPRRPGSLDNLIRVRLPYTLKPNPVAAELEYFSVGQAAFFSLRSRGTSLENAIRGELEQVDGDVAEWLKNPNYSHRLRRDADLWRTMVMGAILDAGSDNARAPLAQRYLTGRESLGRGLGRVVGLSDGPALTQFEEAVLNPAYVPLDRLTPEAVARLAYNAWLHAQRTADNARAAEIFLFCFLAVVGFFEMGGIQFLAFLLRSGAPAWAGEGFGEAFGANEFLMQGVFGAFMGFVGYTKEVGELLAKGDVAEEEVNGLLVSIIGMFIPALLGGLSVEGIPAIVSRVGEIALLPVQVAGAVLSFLQKMVWLVSSMQELMESYALTAEVAQAAATSFMAARTEFEIIVPGMPE